MALSIEEREQFLAEPHVAAFSVAVGPDRGPLSVPIWYHYTPGGLPWILTGRDSRKARLIRAAGRFALMVDEVEPRTRYVSVEGAADREEADEDDVRHSELAHRYLPPDKAEAYLAFARANLPPHVVFHLRPEHWLSADLTP